MAEEEQPLQEVVYELEPQDFLPSLISERFRMSYKAYAALALVVIFFFYQIVGGALSVVAFGLKQTGSATELRFSTMLAQLLFLLVPTLAFIYYQTTDIKKFLRLKLPQPMQIVYAIVGVFSLGQVLQVFVYLQEKIPLPPEVQSLIDQMKQMMEEMTKTIVQSNSVPELLFVLIVVAVVPAICEEFMFRGLIQQNYERAYGLRKGFIVTGVLFGAYHLNPFLIIPLASLGVYFGFLVARSGSIWVSVVAHFINNGLAAVAVYMNKGEDFLVTGKPEEISPAELAATAFIGGAIFIISTYYFLKSTEEVPFERVS